MYLAFVKRALDLLFAFIVSPIVLLVLAVLAIAIKIEDRGPVIYRASRMGRAGQPFTMYKLRSMKINAPDVRLEDGSAYSGADDPRQTRIGRWLRRTSLDELPQLLNVFKGDMSFIGPRPDDLKEAELYQTAERRKLELRPGISGYAQVSGRNAITWRERLALDVAYVDKVSFLLDVRIFFKTFSAVFSQRDIYVEKIVAFTWGDSDEAPESTLSNHINLVSLVVVALDEQDFLPRLLSDIVAQDFPHGSIEVLLVDSNAQKNLEQRQQMESFAQADHGFHRVLVLDNQQGSLPVGCNVALEAYLGDVFIRIDAHARIATDFIRRSIEVLEEGHAVCGGPRPVVLEQPDPWQETLLAAEVSVFGASAAGYRRLQPAHSARSVFHGAYRRQVFEQVGRYDTRLQRTEDNDMSQRIRKEGFQIYFDPRIRSEQFLRPSLAGMLKQKSANGYWIGRTIWLKPLAVSFMHLVPLLFVSAVIAGMLLGFFVNWLPLIALATVYLLANLFFSVQAIVRAPNSRLSMLALPVVFLLLHLAYGFGTLGGLLHGYCRPIYRSFVPSKPSDQKS